jgi:hypothetical protein
VRFLGAPRDVLCIRYERVVDNDNWVLQIPEQRHRRHFVKVTVQVHEYPDNTLARSFMARDGWPATIPTAP